MSITAGNTQSVTVGAALPTALGVNIVDTYGNPVPNMVVTFTAPASGASGTFAACSGGNNASFTTCLVATNAAGTATASTFTTNHTAGAIAVATSAAGDTTPPTFSETSTAGTATTIAAYSGAGQSATVATSFTNPLLAEVTDTYGNPVSGATVTFTAPAATGASRNLLATTNGGTCLATGGTPVAWCTSTTSATGLASSLTFKADTHAGTYNVGATSTGRTPTPVNFTATNTAALTVTSVASGTGTTSATSGAFSMTSGATYLVTAFENAERDPDHSVPYDPGAPTSNLITTNDFGEHHLRQLSGHSVLYVRMVVQRKHDIGHATVKVAQTNGADFVVDVLALAGNNTSAPIVQSIGSESGCNTNGCTPERNDGIGQPDERHCDWRRVRGDHRQR